jgi:hypothetical protein
MDLAARAGEYELLLRRAAETRTEALRTDALGPDLEQVHRLLDLAGALGITINLWQIQNTYHDVAHDNREMLANRPEDDANQVAEFWRLGERLYFNLESLRATARTSA